MVSYAPMGMTGGTALSLLARHALLGAAVGLAVACGSADPEEAPDTSGGGSGSGGAMGLAVALRFDSDAPISVAPREQLDVAVWVTPPGAHSVSFALLPGASVTKPHDASLDHSEVLSDAEGRASVRLTAPSFAVDLSLKATVGTVSITAPIVVTSDGLTTIEVRPNYLGHRTVLEWVAGVHPGISCGGLPDGIPPDGDPSVTVPRDEPAVIEDVPVGEPLAVTLRSGQSIGGCSSVQLSSSDDHPAVYVSVADRPIRLSATTLSLSLGLADDDAAFGALLEVTSQAVVTRVGGESGDDVVALLDAMGSTLVVNDRTLFAEAREAQDWDTSVRQTLGEGSETRIADSITRWTLQGQSALHTPSAFEALLSPTSGGSNEVAPEAVVPARLTLLQVGGLTPELTGFSVADPVSWSADASDTLAIGAGLEIRPSYLLTALAQGAAVQETGAVSAPEALAVVLGCPRVALAMVPAATPEAPAFGTCAASCVETLCHAGTAKLWQTAREPPDEEPVTLDLTATGSAEVGEQAEVVALKGTWIGRLETDQGLSTTGGALDGTTPPPDD